MDILSLDLLSVDISAVFAQLRFNEWLDDFSCDFLKKHVKFVRVNSYEILMNEGDDPDYFYFVYSGRFIVTKSSSEDDGEVVLGSIIQGDTIGEMAIISSKKRTATVISVRESYLLMWSYTDIKYLLEKSPRLAVHISEITINRMGKLLSDAHMPGIRDDIKIVSLVSAGQGAPDVSSFSKEFFNALTEYEKVFTLGPDMLGKLDEECDLKHIDKPSWPMAVSRLIVKLEQEYDLILLNTSSPHAEWMSFCLNSSEGVILYAEHDSSKELNKNEKIIFDNKNKYRPIYLVIKHQYSNKIHGTTDWLDNRPVSSVHHIAENDSKSIQRLARIFTNQSVSLVLSGGGSNGYAHIGLLRALHESNIEIDAIGGVSIGSFIGALYASGKSLDEIRKQLKYLMQALRKPWALQIPFSSMLNPKYVHKVFKSALSDVNIEDLWLSYFCLSCNLAKAQDTVFTQGPVFETVISSCTIPGTLSPACINGDLFIDGGATNTLPGDVMKKRFPGVVLGAMVARERPIDLDSHYKKFPTSKQYLLNIINPFSKKKKIPSIFEILNRSVVVGNKSKLQEVKKQIDFTFEPDLSSGGIFFYDFNKLEEIGYQHAMENMHIIKKIIANVRRQ